MIQLENGKYFQYEIIGEFHSNDGWIHPKRTINSFELIFVLDGTVYIEEEGMEYKVGANEIILLEPYKQHAGSRKSDTKVAFYWFHFQTNMTLPCKTHSGTDLYDIKYLLKKLLHIANTPLYHENTADAVGLIIFQELLYHSNSPHNANRAFVRKIVEYIRINCKHNLSVSTVAQHFGYNADYLGKLFKQNYKIGLKEYIASERLKIAKDLLLTTNLSVKEISAEMGFEQENLFIKFFIYHEGISPTRFKNKYFNTHMNNH